MNVIFCRPLGKAKSSGSVLGDNFVRLNMKLKRYKRKGGRPVSGPAAKRLAWKQKMQARNQSRGNGCFKCGETGHWAKDCKGKYSSGEVSALSAVIICFIISFVCILACIASIRTSQMRCIVLLLLFYLLSKVYVVYY